MEREGLGKAPQPPQAGQPPMNGQQPMGGAQPEGKDAPGAETMPTPQMRAAYNKVHGMSLKMLYSEQFMPKAEEIVKNAPSTEAGVAQIATVIGARIYKMSQQAGDQIPDEVMLLGGWQVMQNIAEFARTDVGVDMSDEQVEAAFYLASDELRAMLGDTDIGANVAPEEHQKLVEMSGGDEGAQKRKKSIAAALIGGGMKK